MLTKDQCERALCILLRKERRELPSQYGDVLARLLSQELGAKIVCLCGSRRFDTAFQEAMLAETLAGRIALTVRGSPRPDAELGGVITPDVGRRLDALYKKKIELADEVLVLNVGGYVGDFTRSEIEYARRHGKGVRWLEGSESR